MVEPFVLIVEPDDGDAAAIVEIIRVLSPGTVALRAGDAISALERLKAAATPPACVVLNAELSASGGLALMTRLSSSPDRSPVVLFSAGAAVEEPLAEDGRWIVDILPGAADRFDALVGELRAVLPASAAR